MTAATLAPATDSPITDPPLTDLHRRALTAATQRAEPIRRAARVASFNAWTTAIITALSAPFALLSVVGFLAFAVLAAVAWNEFRGRRQLLEFNSAGATRLGRNQLGLLALITLYCVWAIYYNLWGSNSIAAQLHANPKLANLSDSLPGVDALLPTIIVAFYGTVIAISALFQGANALYYFSRRKYVEAYVRETPAWVIDLQRATA
jgi:hypothetical protein